MLQPYFTEMVGQGFAFDELKTFIRSAAAASHPALLLGEAGTGKETAARSIHLASSRRNHPFLTVDCSLYYEGELERELFGETDRSRPTACRMGILEFASKGTCYLANLEETSPSIQERLVNYLGTGFLQRVGSEKPVRSRVRLIVSSDKDIAGFAAGGLFSAALFAVIRRHGVEVSPLRKHPEDIRPFARQLADLFTTESAVCAWQIEFSSDCWEALEVYPWPGNYDELKKELLRVFRSGSHRVTPELLSPEISQHWLGLRGEPKVRRVIDEIAGYIEEFKIMARLDSEYGSLLLDTDDWDLHMKEYARA